MYGSFNKSAQETWDFVRCQRSDGTFYGTSGKCRQGNKVGPKEEPKPKPKVSLETRREDPGEEYDRLMREYLKALRNGTDETPEGKELWAKIKQAEKAAASAFRAAQRKRDNAQKKVKLTDAEKQVISDYTADKIGGNRARSYEKMNRCLRNPKSCKDKKTAAQFAKEMDSVLAKLPKNDEGHRFFRGVNATSPRMQELYKMLETAEPGTVFTDPGYSSYSAERYKAEKFAYSREPNIMFVSRSPRLTPINVNSEVPTEYEAILPRGTQQTIRRVTRDGETLIVELD